MKVEAGGGVRGRTDAWSETLGLRLDRRRAAEPDLLLVLDGQVEEAREVVELALHVGVEQRRISFAAPPEGVAGTTELVRDLEGFLNLRSREREGVEIGTRRRAVHISRVAEKVGRAPEQLDAGACLFVLQDLDDLVEVGVALFECFSLGRDVAVVERVERRAELLKELKSDQSFALRIRDRSATIVPRPIGGTRTKRIAKGITERMPVHHREPQVLLERLAPDDLVRIVVLEFERIPRARTTIGNLGNVGEKLRHRLVSTERSWGSRWEQDDNV